MASVDKNANNPLKNKISKELRAKANDFLNNKAKANNLVDIIQYLQKTIEEKQTITPALLTLEVVFTELLRRRDLLHDKDIVSENPSEAETKYRNWLNERYEETWCLMLNAIDYEKSSDASQALVSCMKILTAEGKYPLQSTEPLRFPRLRLRRILEKLISGQRLQTAAIQSFKEYAEYLDVVQNCWHLLPNLIKKPSVKNETLALNYLELIQAIPVTDSLQEQQKLLCPLAESAPGSELFEYNSTRRCINKVWNNLMLWLDTDTTESVHKQMLIVLLERILTHLEKPVLLTDFLMDSLDCGGAISLLALQGVFTLIQKHNITYPNIYEKLYSMFEPEIFHTKFKARLFYLADIFLSSTHLPENLVAAFVKRLARLSLIAPPQDAIIILYFIGNLILRHNGLKSLICAQQAQEVSEDPFIMEEREPTKSNAIKSSLWEIVALQKHAIPSVATAARFISQPLPKNEWDLSSVLEVKEDDIFDQEITKKTKQYALAFERPQTVFLPKNDKVQQHWCLL
ncbi:nucleolar complex protein 4 homolog A [Lucilia sericata]|uniref:nucleolar complex protein 4 homolog A n=1 Tax=Lucilia sericata TaxID=13632 RepID=UPI0018A85DE7|nr:nucleolar complex protein 4 homolog A [Lucilia sericata]